MGTFLIIVGVLILIDEGRTGPVLAGTALVGMGVLLYAT